MPAKSERPRVSVVVPVYNGADQIGHCIEALRQQTLPADSYEIIIVNNASVDDTEKIIKRYPVRLLYEAKRGPAAARNTGIRAADADLIAFTDADCIPHEDWLEHLVDAMSDTICGAGAELYPTIKKIRSRTISIRSSFGSITTYATKSLPT